MKYPLAALLLLACPTALLAQDVNGVGEKGPFDFDFEIEAEVKLRYIPLTNERDIVLKDYSEYEGHPYFEMGLMAHLKLFDRARLDAYPYFWLSEEQTMARIGLVGEAKYELLEDYLEVGWSHHSWHNADIDTPNNRGRSQDALFAKFNFYDLELGDSDVIKFYLDGRWFTHNGEPIEVKDVYGSGEPKAVAEIALPIRAEVGHFDFGLRPYTQFAEGVRRYGSSGEVVFHLSKTFAFFVDGSFYTTNAPDNEEIYMVGAGVLIKLR